MLNPSDVYVSGGSNNLLACWTDKVTKYDASSFYNWEQDNLPLHDLDERTHLLWEKFGHPTSALTGMSFIVSADATSSCNPLYFTTLSACIDALPEVINCPILIEVASFGNLGGLNLSNKAFGPNGALEIINRNSAFAYPRSLDTTRDQYNKLQYDSSFSDYNLASSIRIAGTLAEAYLKNNLAGPNPATDHVLSYAYTRQENGNKIRVASGTTAGDWVQDVRFANPYVFVKRGSDQVNNRLSVGLSSTIDPWDKSATEISGTISGLSFEPFEKNNSDSVYDVSTTNLLTNLEEKWGNGTDDEDPAYGAMSFSYFNSLDYIKVNECNGPVYIRNFNIDGQHTTDRGIEITNSQVNLERCSVSRCNKAGLYANNSEVNILRGIVAYRNYEVINSVRTGVPFESKTLSYDTQSSYGAGIFAENSKINFKSTYDRDIEKSLEASANVSEYNGHLLLLRVTLPGSSIALPSQESLTCFSRNDIGIHAVNSLITGGRTELNGVATGGANARWFDATQIFSELNTEAGIKLENSVLDYDGRVLLDGNYFGLDSTNSDVKIDSLAARFNQSTGLNLLNSKLTYNNNLYASILQSTVTSVENFYESQIACIKNGQDIVCDNSVVEPLYTSSMPSLFSMVYTSGCFGRGQDATDILPSIQLKDSTADLIHAHINREDATSGVTNGLAQYGLGARVEDNSTLYLRGSENYANVFKGPHSRGNNTNLAGLYANNGSTIKIQGPTVSVNFGVNALAENNSNIEITPLQTDSGNLLVSSFDLSNPNNHTMVELHSTRACLVANRNSNILIENVGDYQNKWTRGSYGSSVILNEDYELSAMDNYASAGFVQFYPNANIDATAVVDNPTLPTGNSKYTFVSMSPTVATVARRYLHDMNNAISDISTGGMCLRAVENSLVQTNNVHFPATWPTTSSVIYDIDGTAPLEGPDCSRLFIWNIADESLLKASYISVSGVHPRDSGYHGPSGSWGVSAAPISTPDTSSLSVLDYYGKSEDNPFGRSASGENFGAFRLYFSVDPVTNFMVANDANNDLDGWARQVFAQGYNFSGNLIASTVDSLFGASSNHISILTRDANGNVQTSGFYYASSMLANPNSTRAVLDDSALNTFANAKHNTVGKSGLAKIVQGYYGVKDFGGDSYSDYDYGKGVASINNFDLKKDN